MKQQEYDGNNGLGLKKHGIVESLLPHKLPKYSGLGFVPVKVTIRGIELPSSETVNASNEIETSEEYYTNSDLNLWEWGSEKSFNDYNLEEKFREPSQPTFKERFNQMFKIGPPQNLSNSHQKIPLEREDWIETFWECDDSTSVFTLSSYTMALDNTNDGLPLVYPQLIDWDQQEPQSLDTFEDDEAIVEFMELREGIPSGDHKVGFVI